MSAQLRWNDPAIIRLDTWISKRLYKWLVSKVATHPQMHWQGNYRRKHVFPFAAAISTPSGDTAGVFSPQVNRRLWERWQSFRFPTHWAGGKGGWSDRETPFQILHPWMDTHRYVSIFQAYTVQLVSEPWWILQEKNYGSLHFCSQILMALSRQENRISVPYGRGLAMQPTLASELHGKWCVSLMCRSFRASMWSPGSLFPPV